MKKLIILTSLLLTACANPKLPEPKIDYPVPPAVLMEAPENMHPIKEIPNENSL